MEEIRVGESGIAAWDRPAEAVPNAFPMFVEPGPILNREQVGDWTAETRNASHKFVSTLLSGFPSLQPPVSSPMALTLMFAMMSRNALASGLS